MLKYSLKKKSHRELIGKEQKQMKSALFHCKFTMYLKVKYHIQLLSPCSQIGFNREKAEKVTDRGKKDTELFPFKTN